MIKIVIKFGNKSLPNIERTLNAAKLIEKIDKGN